MKKSKGFIAEFKEFAIRGNVIDLAVGVIIGGAFQAIVASFISDIVMPLIGLATKGLSFANKFIVLNGTTEDFKTAEEAIEAGKNVLTYGAFINAIFNFIIMALVIFLFVKFINKLRSKDKEEEAPTTKTCPFCKSEVDIEATKCPHCTSDLPEE
ncbi:MAG: large conductance mechanosensitive channel protein MscL [Clostridiales bacterium]|nr:large conductance mechanosensitive channel protein MscL [Clostridiales bacterium]